MNANHAILIIVIMLAIVLGEMLAQVCLIELSKRRRKRAKREPPLRTKSESQSIEFNMVLSGVDDVEAGLERVEAAMVRIAEATGGVPITINNYYNTPERVEEE